MEAANPIPVRTNAIVSIIVYSYGDVRIKSSIRVCYGLLAFMILSPLGKESNIISTSPAL